MVDRAVSSAECRLMPDHIFLLVGIRRPHGHVWVLLGGRREAQRRRQRKPGRMKVQDVIRIIEGDRNWSRKPTASAVGQGSASGR